MLCGRRVRDCMNVIDPVGGRYPQRKGVNCDAIAKFVKEVKGGITILEGEREIDIVHPR